MKVAEITTYFLVLIVIIFMMLAIIRKRKKQRSMIRSYIDIHSHMLSGVDDGAKDAQMSLEMIKESYKQGVRKLILTPHYYIGGKNPSVQELKDKLEELKQQAAKECSEMELYLGNEILYSDGIVEKLNEGRVLTLADSRYVLVEYRPSESFNRILNSVILLQRQRYLPIIAHVERYENVMKEKNNLKELKDMGALLQMNASSVKKYIRYIKEGWIDFIATDCHNLSSRAPKLADAAVSVCQSCDEEVSRKVLYENGEKIIFKNIQKKGSSYGKKSEL